MRRRLAAGEEVARMYQEPGLAWLEWQAEVAEDLVAERQAAEKPTADGLWPDDGRCCVKQVTPLLDQRRCCDRACDLGICCRCVSALAV
jgi:hypothetical protein